MPDFDGQQWVARPPQPIAWLPEGYAWVSNIPRPVLRKAAVGSPLKVRNDRSDCNSNAVQI